MALKVIVCLFVMVTVAYTQGLVGGYTPITDLNSPDVQTPIAEARAQLLSSNANVCESGLTVVSGEKQLVNGMNYKFQFTSNPTTCGQNGPPITCQTSLYISFSGAVTPKQSNCQ